MIKLNRNHRRAAAKGNKTPKPTFKITPRKHGKHGMDRGGGTQRHKDTNLFQRKKEGDK